MGKAHLIGLAVMIVVVVLAQPVSAAALTSTVQDPAGDAFFDGTPIPAAGYEDILQATVTSEGSSFTLVLTLAAPIPDNPVLSPGVALQTWGFALNTNLATTPIGYPFAPGLGAPAEYFVRLIWDGTTFQASLADRTPLLTGGQATETAVPFFFSADRSQFSLSVTAAILGNPSAFKWRAFANEWTAPFGTQAFFVLDSAPDAGFVSWPSA